ncbi:MAG: homocysteine S-methyltransferase family protein [Actinomycetes bacterium]|jgi:5-methyltetrahydrofolate--homocysteine methyltransferase|nr:homocysteine S-methyltransferase family protein [Actinomycetes bacterium]
MGNTETFQHMLGRRMLVLEGAMGTMLQTAGIDIAGAPEELNLTHADAIIDIHRRYCAAGATCAITNTFGGSRPKLDAHACGDRVGQLNASAVRLARAGGAPYVLADIGPTGLVLDPLGSADFETVYAAFLEQARALASQAPDAFLLETYTDIAEARCAVLACREAAPEIPVLALVTFGVDGRMELSGTDPATAALILQAAGAAAVGMNCGLGPDQMLPLLEQMAAGCDLPLVVQPNAGLPRLDADGNTVFPGTPDDFTDFSRTAAALGVAAIGSCCGSNPDFTAAIAAVVGNADVVARDAGSNTGVTAVASPQQTVRIGGTEPVRLIGERINPTGKPELRESLMSGSMTVVRRFAAEQQAAGADLLDVNVGAAGIDEATVLPAAVRAATSAATLPLSIDTTDAAALEAALRRYPGRALVNSVTGEARSIQRVLPLVARYGACVVVLALDDNGIPATVEGRLDVVRRVREGARAAGIDDSRLLVDGLVMAAAADPVSPDTTLDVARRVRTELGLSTLLGVSNVSHGLPNRAALNAAFLTAAAAEGLSAAIVNPNDTVIREAVGVANQTRSRSGIDDSAPDTAARAAFNALLTDALKPAAPEGAGTHSPDQWDALPAEDRLRDAITFGDTDGAPDLVDRLVADGMAPAAIIADVLTPAIRALGDGFATGEVFLPQLMVAADAMKAAVARAKSHLPAADAQSVAGRVVFATVKGDIHSIGKDICISLLESQSFQVTDLGVDVAAQAVLDAARDTSADLVCLSALMTTTLPAMADTVALLHDCVPDVAVGVGGAVVTRDWATQHGALYTKDAPQLVEVATRLVAEQTK